MSLKNKYIVYSFTVLFGVLGLIFAILNKPIALIFILFMGISAIVLVLPEFIEERKKKRKKYKRDQCPYCGGQLIFKEDLWISDEEWGIPENYMCIKCGKGIDIKGSHE